MKRKNFVVVAITLMLMVACISPAPTTDQGNNPGDNITAGSDDFGAQATSANSILLTWPATAGAEKYLLDLQTDAADFLPLIELPSNQTSYEDIGVPEAFAFTYRLRVRTASGTSAGLTLTINTPAATPNPLTVQANDYAPIAWTPPTPDPGNPNVDPSIYYPPGFDPEHPEDYDPANAVQQVQASADIGPEGGTLSITTPDNITFDLTIPPGALEESTLISLIPIETIDGLPFDGGLQGAVRIEPDGLMLDLPANLRITRADAATLSDGMVALAFGFDGSGQEFHLMPFAPAAQTGLHPGAAHMASLTASPLRAGPLADIALQQLKEYGIGNATPQEAAVVVKSHRPTAAEAGLLNQLAYGESDLGLVELVPLVSRQRLATSKLLSLAQSEAPDWSQMTVSLAELEILTHYYGKDPKLTSDLAKILDLLLDRLTKMLENNPNKCLTGDDPYAQAVAGKILGAKPGSMYAALKKKLDPQLLKDVAERRKKCTLFLTIQSKITEDDKVSVANEVQVRGEIGPLKFNFQDGKVFLTGRGDLANFYEDVKISPYPVPSTVCAPWKPDNIDSVKPQVIVTKIDLVIAKVPNGALQEVKLFPMTISDRTVFMGKMNCTHTQPDGTIEKYALTQKIPALRNSLWYGFFTAAHMPNLTLEFKVQPAGSRIIASVNYDRPSFSPGYGTWSEDSTFELVDKGPQ